MFFKFFRRELKPFNTGFLPSKDGMKFIMPSMATQTVSPCYVFMAVPEAVARQNMQAPLTRKNTA